MEAPVLVYPSFSPDATEFVLQIDVSAVGLGAVLEQKNILLHMLADLSPAQSIITVLLNVNTWPLSLPWNNFLTICLVTHFNYVLIMLHCNGYQLKKWKACCADGH